MSLYFVVCNYLDVSYNTKIFIFWVKKKKKKHTHTHIINNFVCDVKYFNYFPLFFNAMFWTRIVSLIAP